MIHGRNRDLLTFWRPDPGKDTLGNPVGTYTQIADALGDIEDTISARDGQAQLQEQGYVSVRIYTGWDPLLATLTPRDQIRSGDRRFDIRGGPLGVEGKQMLTFLCEIHQSEVVNR